MPTVISGWTRSCVEYAARFGIARAELLAKVGLDRALLAGPDQRVPYRRDRAVWRSVAAALRDPDLGLHFAESAVRAGTFGSVGFAMQTSGTVEEALVLAVRFHRLLSDQGVMELSGDGSRAVLSVRTPDAETAWPRPIAEAVLASYVVLIRRWAHDPVSPTAVHFQHRRPRQIREHERVFGCRVMFDQPTNALAFPREALAIRLTRADAELCAYLQHLAGIQLAALSIDPWVGDVRRAIAEALVDGESNLGAVARRLRTSARTLQRELANRGHGFQELLGLERNARSLELLRDHELSFAQISDRLGFSEPSAFRRAFRRWTGRSPRAYRKAWAAE